MRDLRYDFKKLDRQLRAGESVQITRRKRVIGTLIPEGRAKKPRRPDFLARLRRAFGNKKLRVTGAALVGKDRGGR